MSKAKKTPVKSLVAETNNDPDPDDESSVSSNSLDDAINEIEADTYDEIPTAAVVDDDDRNDYGDDDIAIEVGASPETRQHVKVVVIVKPENMRTSSIMSLFEMTEYVSIRGHSIAKYGNCTVDATGLSETDAAKRELMMRRSPLVIRRHVGDLVDENGQIESYYERWNPNEMIFATTYDV